MRKQMELFSLLAVITLCLSTELAVANDIPSYNPSDYIRPWDSSVQKVASENKGAKALYEWVGRNIRYESDEKVWDTGDYWQLPNTTIRLGTGDCEDQAILLASLLSTEYSKNDVRFVFGKLESFGGQSCYHAWVEIRRSSIRGFGTSSTYESLDNLVNKTLVIWIGDKRVEVNITREMVEELKRFGLCRDQWVPLDTAVNLADDTPFPFEVWMQLGYRAYSLGLSRATPEYYYTCREVITGKLYGIAKTDEKEEPVFGLFNKSSEGYSVEISGSVDVFNFDSAILFYKEPLGIKKGSRIIGYVSYHPMSGYVDGESEGCWVAVESQNTPTTLTTPIPTKTPISTIPAQIGVTPSPASQISSPKLRELKVSIEPEYLEVRPGDTANCNITLDWSPKDWRGEMKISAVLSAAGFEKKYELPSATPALNPPIVNRITFQIPDIPPLTYKLRLQVEADSLKASDETTLKVRPSTPGFEAVVAIIAGVSVLALRRRRGSL